MYPLSTHFFLGEPLNKNSILFILSVVVPLFSQQVSTHSGQPFITILLHVSSSPSSVLIPSFRGCWDGWWDECFVLLLLLFPVGKSSLWCWVNWQCGQYEWNMSCNTIKAHVAVGWDNKHGVYSEFEWKRNKVVEENKRKVNIVRDEWMMPGLIYPIFFIFVINSGEAKYPMSSNSKVTSSNNKVTIVFQVFVVESCF